MTVPAPLLSVDGLVKRYRVPAGFLAKRWMTAVDAVDLEIGAGETLGLVGESGSGKTSLIRCIMRIQEPTAGSIRFDGVDLTSLDSAALRAKRREMAIVYQNPYLSLNPRLTVEALIAEPIVTLSTLHGSALKDRIEGLLRDVGLGGDYLDRRSHELSGGQAQRVAIARALAMAPKLMILDEPTSALDVSVQAQILNLLQDLQSASGFSYLFVSHNIDVIRHVSDRVAVMHRGKIVECGNAADVLDRPQAEHTQVLIAAVPSLERAYHRWDQA